MHSFNQNNLIINHGATGSGKTTASLGLGHLLDPNFSLDNVVFSTADFIALIRSKKLKPGAVIVYEEAGVGANARNYYTQENKALSFINQIFRTMNFTVIYTVPNAEFVDAQLRPLFHYMMVPIKIDRVRKENLVKFQNVYYDMRMRLWKPTNIIINRAGKSFKIVSIRIPKPNDAFMKAYDKKRKEFTEATYKSTEQSIIDAGKKKETFKDRLPKIVDEIVSKNERYVKDGRLDGALAAQDFSLNSSTNLSIVRLEVKKRMNAIGFTMT